jgi:hypothetical protein
MNNGDPALDPVAKQQRNIGMNKRNLLTIFAALAILLLVLAGCAAPTAPTGAPAADATTAAAGEAAPAGDAASTLVVAIAEDTASLDPGARLRNAAVDHPQGHLPDAGHLPARLGRECDPQPGQGMDDFG